MLPQEEWKKFDVITCAAPNLSGRTQEEYPLDVQYNIHLRRAEHILSVAAANNDRILVLGAFGCGAFNNPPDLVARCFRYYLVDKGYRDCFKRVVFAIKSVGRNYEVFRDILME
jgi:uncharacterized protein (TIGR02452 family)